MGTRTDNTMIEWLSKLMKDIAEAKTLPDADRAFLVQLENIVLNRMDQPAQDYEKQGLIPQTSPATGPAMQAPPMGGGGMAMGVPPQAQDEMRRMLQSGPSGLPA